MARRTPNGADESLADLFWSVGNQLRGARRESLAPLDVSPSQARALVTAARHGALRQRELSDHLRITPRSTTEVVDALEQRDLVRRRPDPSDRRATLVEVTEHGSTLLRALRKARSAEAERVFDRLDEREQRTLRELLGKLVDTADDADRHRHS